jgi:hypothetical protein
MEKRGTASVDCRKTVLDGRVKFTRVGYIFAIGAECASDVGEASFLTLPIIRKP